MTATGKTYGDALYDLAAEEALCDELLEQVKLLARLFRENPQYPALLASPDIPREERLHLIGEALTGQVHPYLVNFLCLLCERGRLPAFAGCAARYEQRTGHPPKNVYGESLFPVTAAAGIRWASKHPDAEVVAIIPRYLPAALFWVPSVPLLREFVTWNVALILRKR